MLSGLRKRKFGDDHGGGGVTQHRRTPARITEEVEDFTPEWSGSAATEEKKKVSYKEVAAEFLNDQ